MTLHQLTTFLRRKIVAHYLVTNTGPVEIEHPAPGWNDLKTERQSFLLVSAEQGYRVTVEPVELAP